MENFTRKILIAILAVSIVFTIGGLLDIAAGDNFAKYHNAILNVVL